MGLLIKVTAITSILSVFYGSALYGFYAAQQSLHVLTMQVYNPAHFETSPPDASPEADMHTIRANLSTR